MILFNNRGLIKEITYNRMEYYVGVKKTGKGLDLERQGQISDAYTAKTKTQRSEQYAERVPLCVRKARRDLNVQLLTVGATVWKCHFVGQT